MGLPVLPTEPTDPIEPRPRLSRRLPGLLAIGLAAALAVTGVLGAVRPGAVSRDVAPAASTTNPATPGNFTGYGFDQCLAPSQSAMDAWWSYSPYAAVGIYVSGDSRGCPSQPNLTPTWVRTQLARGWRLLPITLGPQASCTTRDRYRHQVRIDPSTSKGYAAAKSQGYAEAKKTVARAASLGIVQGSTLWYDIEAFDTSNTACRESAKSFLSGWTLAVHYKKYVSGVYSSAASGIRMLYESSRDQAGRYLMPDQLWIADWNGTANTSTSYIPDGVWAKHQRVHQYRGGHGETWGGTTIDVDNNYLDLGTGSTMAAEPRHCGGAATYNRRSYPNVTSATTDKGLIRTAQCLLGSRGYAAGPVSGAWSSTLAGAIARFHTEHGSKAWSGFGQWDWIQLLTEGTNPTAKIGSTGYQVRRLQRALNATGVTRKVDYITGVYGRSTANAVADYQRRLGYVASGVASTWTWTALMAGRH